MGRGRFHLTFFPSRQSPSPSPTLTRHADVIATEPTSLMLWDELVLRAFFDEQPAVHLPACPSCFVVRASSCPLYFRNLHVHARRGPGARQTEIRYGRVAEMRENEKRWRRERER